METMAALIATINTVFTAIVGMVGNVATLVADTPIFLIGCIIPLCGLGIRFFIRLRRL